MLHINYEKFIQDISTLQAKEAFGEFRLLKQRRNVTRFADSVPK